MADVVDAATRSRMMAGIRGKDTQPEMILRRGLHARGFRFRLHDRRLPGSPDLVFPGRRAAVFVHGCFWHGHTCPLFRLPATRQEFWRAKIEGNAARDKAAEAALLADGWRVLTIWECALKGRERLPVETVLDRAAEWLVNGRAHEMIAGGAYGGI
ncbi:very short patch repair endonuclease [Roseicyclus mahoneyensis]|uniref:Very short patch repair endonuclease n=1 Tax=Roseicyclus mahoneyensis TaxID=164332 RepID=A0A316G736_9RHOB|nr:very short patch repair endonuclease [Roseicyclus mahoneyensis]PWK55600.1 T/G mismatch-specific endonuclease [Roseicyclus mahoneyensis]